MQCSAEVHRPREALLLKALAAMRKGDKDNEEDNDCILQLKQATEWPLPVRDGIEPTTLFPVPTHTIRYIDTYRTST